MKGFYHRVRNEYVKLSEYTEHSHDLFEDNILTFASGGTEENGRFFRFICGLFNNTLNISETLQYQLQDERKDVEGSFVL